MATIHFISGTHSVNGYNRVSHGRYGWFHCILLVDLSILEILLTHIKHIYSYRFVL